MTHDMKLSARDKKILLSMGHPSADLPQIEEAIKKTEYTLCNIKGDDIKKLSPVEAQKRLGQRAFLSGLGRSAFHWSAFRECGKTRAIYFDSSALFE